MNATAVLSTELKRDFQTDIRLMEREAAERLTTFAVGGTVSLLVEPLSEAALSKLIQKFSRLSVPFRVIGVGSNVVLPDGESELVLIRLGRELSGLGVIPDARSIECPRPVPSIESYEISGTDPVRVLAFGGASFMALSRKCSSAGLSGLEFAAGIPASVGGAIKMNAGAHNSSVSDVLELAFVVDLNGEISVRLVSGIGYEYRRSNFLSGEIILGGIFSLRPGEKDAIQKRRSECLDYRKRTQPLTLPSAGSVFRNPESVPSAVSEELQTTRIYAAQLLERCGLKGKRLGGVGFSELHSNWLVKLSPDAKSDEVKELIELAREKVFQHFGVELIPEILLW